MDSVADIFERQAKERQIEAGKEHGRGAEKVVALVPQAMLTPCWIGQLVNHGKNSNTLAVRRSL